MNPSDDSPFNGGVADATTLPAQPHGPRIGKACLLCAIFYVAAFAAAIPMGVYFYVKKLAPDPILLPLVSQLVAWPVAIWFALFLTKRSWRETFAIKSFSPRLLPGLIVGCFGFTLVLLELTAFMPMPEAWENAVANLDRGNPVIFFVSVCVIAPVAEELFFRGWMLRGFLANYPARKAIWLTAVIFAVFHLNPAQVIATLPLGLLFAWLTERTGSLAPGMIGHFVANVTATFLLTPFAALFGHSSASMKAATHLPWEIVGIGAVLGALGIGWLWYQLRHAQGNSEQSPQPTYATPHET